MPGHLGQTVVYVIILASAFAVLGEVYGDLLRAGATERLMELLATRSPIASPQNPRWPRDCGGSAIKFEVDFSYPSRPNSPRWPVQPGCASRSNRGHRRA